jgi:hypothetical protein
MFSKEPEQDGEYVVEGYKVPFVHPGVDVVNDQVEQLKAVPA